MHVVITGASGLIGGALARELRARGASITGVSRDPSAQEANGITWVSWRGLPDAVSGAHAVFHLAGAGIADRRWTEKRKAELRSSRIDTARQVVEAIQRAGEKPSVLVSSSAVGYYGDRGDEELSESSEPGSGFLSQLCQDWEAASAGAGIRTVNLRTGLVLAKGGGFLKPQLLPFKLGLGGPVGRGRQWLPWVHIDDVVGMMAWATESNAASGAINATAPTPVRQAEFAKALGRAVHRPAILPTPPQIFSLLLGEGGELLTMSTRALPQRAQELGYPFQFAQIDTALADVV